MAKKPVQFRFEENFHQAIADLSAETGISVSEIVRNAVSLYLTIYERVEGKKTRFYLQTEDNDAPVEILLPWLKY